MAYEYIKRTYNIDPKIGERVTHEITKKSGTIVREDKSASHYGPIRRQQTFAPVPSA